MTRPGVARTLEAIASSGREGFYQGEFGQGLLELGAGEYVPDDLAKPTADWVEPLRVRAFGHDVWSMPPNSQGYLLLLSLGVVDGLDLPPTPDHALWAHLLGEAARIAGHDRLSLLHEHARDLVSETEIARRRAMVDPTARLRVRGLTAEGDTTYLCAVDGDGMGVSLIQSNASGFGSLLVEPRTGINLHNRGIGFSLTPGHPAEYGPGRRPPHTLTPALITRQDGSLRSVVGTMGGDAQPQILLQVITRLLRHGQTPGQAISARAGGWAPAAPASTPGTHPTRPSWSWRRARAGPTACPRSDIRWRACRTGRDSGTPTSSTSCRTGFSRARPTRAPASAPRLDADPLGSTGSHGNRRHHDDHQ
ncbi:gamma-glutamyltransferase [Nonomuraea dietziae]|uniref:gamma-glutamyltransferase n=1 Tax=Nonomuraea dietziae TaxID=65515 RepID=UPI003621B7E4